MSTRSNIGILETDGTVQMIYCHSDGYPSYTGAVLLKHYNSEKQARALVALGDLSYVAPRLAPNEGEKHSYDNHVDDVTVAYHRDRNEPLEPPLKCHSVTNAIGNMEEYLYLWDVKEGKWCVTEGRMGLTPLTKEMCRD